jgi:hypothetical protein
MRPLLLLSVLLLGVSWAATQNAPTQSDQQGYNQTATSTGSQTSVQGCLSGSNGNYTLTDDQGKMYTLTGDTSKLADHVGHEVKITGTESASSGASSGAMSNQSQPTLEVSSMKHISKTCKNGAMSH